MLIKTFILIIWIGNGTPVVVEKFMDQSSCNLAGTAFHVTQPRGNYVCVPHEYRLGI